MSFLPPPHQSTDYANTMLRNKIAHTLLRRSPIAAVSSPLSSLGAPSSTVFASEPTPSQTTCSSFSCRHHAFPFSLRLFNTNSSKHFRDEVKEQNPPQCTDAFFFSSLCNPSIFSYFQASIEITFRDMIYEWVL